jgi:putative adhesin
MTRETATPATIEYQIGPTGRLSVKVADWDLQLVAGPDDVVRVHDTGGGNLPADLEVDRGPESLSIRQASRFPGVAFIGDEQGGKRRLTVELPAQAAVNVQTASGDVEATGLRGDQQFRTASGELRLDATSGSGALETVSGDIAIRVDGSIELVVKSVSGDIAIEGGVIERLRLTSTSGDVRLASDLGPGPHAIATVSGDATLRTRGGLRITALTVAGDLRSERPHTTEGGPGRRSLIVGDGASELQFRSVSGDLRVKDPASPGKGSEWSPLTPVAAPVAPFPPEPPVPPAFAATDGAAAGQRDEAEAMRLDILRALESGEIDVAEATAQLARLDGATDD